MQRAQKCSQWKAVKFTRLKREQPNTFITICREMGPETEQIFINIEVDHRPWKEPRTREATLSPQLYHQHGLPPSQNTFTYLPSDPNTSRTMHERGSSVATQTEISVYQGFIFSLLTNFLYSWKQNSGLK